MRSPSPLLRAIILGVALSLQVLGTGRAFALQHPTPSNAAPASTRFVGQVTSVIATSDGSVVGFTLQLKAHSIDFLVAPHPKIKARSAEAAVEGLQKNDYAMVLARRSDYMWIARVIEFDVQQFRVGTPPKVPPSVTVTGPIQRVFQNGKRFAMTLPNLSTRWVTITSQTRFRLDGQPVAGPEVLTKGDLVQVVMRLTSRGWVALDVNLKTASAAARHLAR